MSSAKITACFKKDNFLTVISLRLITYMLTEFD